MENETHTIDTKSQEMMILEIHEDMRKAKNYMKWQLIITVALVVIPLLASLFVIPYTLKSLGSAYGVGGDLEAPASSSSSTTGELLELLK